MAQVLCAREQRRGVAGAEVPRRLWGSDPVLWILRACAEPVQAMARHVWGLGSAVARSAMGDPQWVRRCDAGVRVPGSDVDHGLRYLAQHIEEIVLVLTGV